MKSRHPFMDIDIEISKSTMDAVDSIRTWLTFQPHLPKLNDEMIMLFLHSCYYSPERSKDTIENYYTMRAKCPEFFANWDFNGLSEGWNLSDMIPLPKPTPEGYRIIVYRLKDFDSSKVIITDLIKCFCAFNLVKISEDGLVPGYIVILDMKGVTFSHFMRVTPHVQSVRNILQYLQECHPVRLKQVHVINTVSFMDRVLSLIKPFIQSNLMNILHLHGSADSLTEYFPLELMSEEYGGKQISGATIHNEFNKVIADRYKQWLQESEKFISIEENRVVKPKKESAAPQLEGSFRRLELD
ncbi:hypothetical protein V9T40_005762 [Parthenolecanium corni]|uniref:CRAL-TRIO domain-containing protein n=1 Tax=Parthenolecanium corni TaxID=536013 RepID=A0AAN9TWX5_9HEMI